MFATPSQPPHLSSTAGPQEPLAPLIFPSLGSSPESDFSVRMASLEISPKHPNAARTVDYGLPLRSISPLPKLKHLPPPRQLSDGISEMSELFKTTSLVQEVTRRKSSRAVSASHSYSPSTCAQDFSQSPFALTSYPIHFSHLFKERLPCREIAPFFSLIPSPPPGHRYHTEARLHSLKFPSGHHLNSQFVELYQLGDELGSGGYGFVMTARRRLSGTEVAVKFIVKNKVPEHAWMEDDLLGRLPTEVVLLSSINHENIVKFLDLFEDKYYFYLVQELHGIPWQDGDENTSQSESMVSTPALSPSASERSLDFFEPSTPPSVAPSFLFNSGLSTPPDSDHLHTPYLGTRSAVFDFGRPDITRRSSYDLFECIEQSQDKCLSESQARCVFTQVVDVVHYLDCLGVTHRDIKDENLVIDKNLKVKLIDFGSACAVDPAQPRPYYTQFFGTAAYASSEILLKKKYQAAPAEVWTLGVLLSFLLTGTSPFPSVRAAAEGRIMFIEPPGVKLPGRAVELMRKCLDPNPRTRITIQQVKEHPWLSSSV